MFGSCGYPWERSAKFLGDEKKMQGKEIKEERIFSEEPEVSQSFSIKAGKGKGELNGDPVPLGPTQHRSSAHTAASLTLRFLDAVCLGFSSGIRLTPAHRTVGLQYLELG